MRFKILKHGGYGSTGLSTTGGNMTGPLVLAGAPTQALEASTKGYVDTALGNLNGASLTGGLIPVERLPAFTGDITNVAGSNSFSLSDSGVTPGSYPRVTVNAKGRITNGYLLTEADLPALDWGKVTTGKPTTMGGYGITDAVSASGSTMNGVLTVNNDPTQPLHIATKGYIDSLNNSAANGSLKTGDLVRKTTSVTPTGFLRCNGSELSRTAYSALFAVIGTTFNDNGYSMPGGGSPWVNQYSFNSTQTGTLGAFSNDHNLDTYVAYAGGLVTKNKVFLIGGLTGSVSGAATTVQAGSYSGNVSWSSYPPALPIGLISPGVALVKGNKVYVVGGTTGTGGQGTNGVYYSTIDANGDLGAWVASANLPATVLHSAAFVTIDRLFCISYSAVMSAPINSNGTLGAWVQHADCPYNLGFGRIIIINNTLYVFCTNSSNYYSVPILGDGTLGTWKIAGTLPISTYYSHVVATSKYVFIISGNASSGIYVAPINADGSIGSWTTNPNSLNYQIGGGVCAAFNDRLYVIGGYNYTLSTYTNQVSYAAWAGGLLDYSAYYNGALTSIGDTNSSNFRLPDYTSKEMPGSYTYIKY